MSTFAGATNSAFQSSDPTYPDAHPHGMPVNDLGPLQCFHDPTRLHEENLQLAAKIIEGSPRVTVRETVWQLVSVPLEYPWDASAIKQQPADTMMTCPRMDNWISSGLNQVSVPRATTYSPFTPVSPSLPYAVATHGGVHSGYVPPMSVVHPISNYARRMIMVPPLAVVEHSRFFVGALHGPSRPVLGHARAQCFSPYPLDRFRPNSTSPNISSTASLGLSQPTPATSPQTAMPAFTATPTPVPQYFNPNNLPPISTRRVEAQRGPLPPIDSTLHTSY
ncbi:hypothetical protein H4R33_000299 [Dimargaris cristalligena]|uniref:Uncharacterized protein n=1 Tax=Dimargaris cristalligena TaxID=215637 RepID=A0A4Q0A256_9FUNG|nr:hypothetical protein H4R33_000299 [Dimargaris cristalligena]RKP40137.1 hypothetical protein BJ085DRAFT_41502 [Dimargaris cristalligena]|eukprot:RKP40137.1 hypothetical protein BJ085DRAFT_41502 [Dimargaris cristalligena]